MQCGVPALRSHADGALPGLGSVPAPMGRGRERGQGEPLQAGPTLEDRGDRANECLHGDGDRGGTPQGQLTFLPGAGIQV